jgi:3-hydroxyisobutyrate dehydrogenase
MESTNLSKDLNNAIQLAQQFNLEIPVAQRALGQLQSHQKTALLRGFSDSHSSSILKYRTTINKLNNDCLH